MHLTPYLSFDGTAREAMEFYQAALGGDLQVITFAQGGALPEGADGADKVMHAALTGGHAERVYASDWLPEVCGGQPFNPGSDVTLSLEGGEADAETLRGIFAKLGEGGQVHMPMQMQDWGDEFGSLTDRFGKGWNVSVDLKNAQR